TGHRILTDLDPVFRGVQAAVDAVRAAYPCRPLEVLSSLAEGTDRIVAEAVLRTPGARLVAVLPFDEAEYVRDFGPEGSPSRLHFDALLGRAAEVVRLPARATPDEGYEQAGHYVLDHCDALLAVWDGRLAQGRGGTGEIVARARALARP